MAGHCLSQRKFPEILRKRRAAARRDAGRRRAIACLMMLGAISTGTLAVAQRGMPDGVSRPRPAVPRPPSAPVEDYQDLWKRGEYAGALTQLNELMMTMSRGVPPRFLFDRAELYFLTGQIGFAVRDMEILCRQISAPVYTLRLAELYRAAGKPELYEELLADALQQARNRWFYGVYEDNVLATARIQELSGENPRTILRTVLDPLIERRPDFAGGYVGAGNLALNKDDYGLAAEYFEKALAADAEHQEALAGLSRSYFESHDPRAESTMERLRALNPNHPRLAELDAEGLIRAARYNEALARAEKGLLINPAQIRLLALKSAALFFLNRSEEMEAVQRAALEQNRHDSEIFRVTGRMASARLRNREAVGFLERALKIDASDSEAEAQLGFALLNLGRDAEGRKRLERAFESDPYDVRIFNMLKVLDSLEQFVTLEREDFRLSLPADEADLIAADAFKLLRDARLALGEKYDVEFSTPIVVQMFDHHDDFMVRTLGFPGAVDYLGICTGQLITMGSPSARPPGEVNWRLVLWHEFMHIVSLQKTKNRMSRWLSEGLSGYEERQRDPAWGVRAAVEYKRILAEDGLPAVQDLERYFSAPQSGAHLSYGYFAAAEFAEYYMKTFGQGAMNRALDRIAEGERDDEALRSAAGISMEALNRGFADHLERRTASYGNLPEIAGARSGTLGLTDQGTTVTLESREWALARSPFTDAMASGLQALKEERWGEAEAQLRRAQELFPEYPGADAPLRLLIGLYERQGRANELEAALKEQIGSHPTDLAAYLRYARLLSERRDWKTVAELAEKGFGINPFDSRLRQARLEAAVALGETDVALEQLAHLARLDAPRAADYELRRVQVLIDAERWEQARNEVFVLLERFPWFHEAQEALLRIVDREGASKTADGKPERAGDEAIRMAAC